jgi:hypothetical protein
MKKLKTLLLLTATGLLLVACNKETKTGVTVGLNNDTDEVAEVRTPDIKELTGNNGTEEISTEEYENDSDGIEVYSDEIEIETTETDLETASFEDDTDTNDMIGFWMTEDNTTIVEFKSDNTYSRYDISQDTYYYGTYDTDSETFITLEEDEEESGLTYYLSISTQSSNDNTFRVATISRGETTIVLVEKDIEETN